MKTNDVFDTIEIPADLETRLESLIDRLAEEEKLKKSKVHRLHWWVGSVAAGVAILLSIGIFLHFDNQKDLQARTYAPEEQEVARLEAEKALVLVSLNFNKGMDQLALAMNEIEKSNNIINKTFKR